MFLTPVDQHPNPGRCPVPGPVARSLAGPSRQKPRRLLLQPCCCCCSQELLVEGPLTNLKPSMIALSQPKRKFDRAAFGVGGVGAGAMGAIGRYHPPEKVGDPIPGAAAAAAAAAGVGSGGGAASNSTAAAAPGRGAKTAAGAADGFLSAASNGTAAGGLGGGSFFGNPLGFSPFAGTSYSIPSLPGADGRGGARGAGKGGSLGGSSRSLNSQLGPATQVDVGGLGASQGGLGLGGFGSLGSMLTQGSGGMGGFSQFGGSATLGGSAGLGLGALGDAPLSQAGFGYGAGAEDYGSVGPGDGFSLTQGTGLSQAGFGDLLGGDLTQQQQQRKRLGS